MATGSWPGGGRIHGALELARQHRQLLDGGRAVDVGGHQVRPALHLFAEIIRQLAGGGRLAGTLQADEQDGHRRGGAEVEAHRLFAHHPGQFLVDDLDELLFGGEAAQDLLAEGFLLDALGEALHDLEVHVGLEQGEANLTHRVGDVFLRDLADAA